MQRRHDGGIDPDVLSWVEFLIRVESSIPERRFHAPHWPAARRRLEGPKRYFSAQQPEMFGTPHR